ncbi:hypothetical protein SAMN06265378_11612 [Paracoccus sediminis]|uniref:Uncharacterized protein n=1 Tax=Paracoccus sediminis TaxID=1214787 RepID=A0A238Y8G7_9RHOB|nr:hypothetical protein SAMN06265378_11612 [Paracoccus sediminis]
MKLRQDHPLEVAAAKADISRATGYRIAQDPRPPSQKAQPRGRRRQGIPSLGRVWIETR